ncbi:hypothetical protein WN51_05954 [Melipona quadrifasciata]|uniref:BTB domain-containing protein n=1 Tax=Melipona quadrifasciata TaxID=166423 RepID=A0A0M9A7I9_9HYME|nr:hypothetical protein WN51_05954 [Melipona quadrifasciata]
MEHTANHKHQRITNILDEASQPRYIFSCPVQAIEHALCDETCQPYGTITGIVEKIGSPLRQRGVPATAEASKQQQQQQQQQPATTGVCESLWEVTEGCERGFFRKFGSGTWAKTNRGDSSLGHVNTSRGVNKNIPLSEQWTGDSLYSTPMAKLDLVHDSMRNISMFSRSNGPSELIRYDPSTVRTLLDKQGLISVVYFNSLSKWEFSTVPMLYRTWMTQFVVEGLSNEFKFEFPIPARKCLCARNSFGHFALLNSIESRLYERISVNFQNYLPATIEKQDAEYRRTSLPAALNIPTGGRERSTEEPERGIWMEFLLSGRGKGEKVEREIIRLLGIGLIPTGYLKSERGAAPNLTANLQDGFGCVYCPLASKSTLCSAIPRIASARFFDQDANLNSSRNLPTIVANASFKCLIHATNLVAATCKNGQPAFRLTDVEIQSDPKSSKLNLTSIKGHTVDSGEKEFKVQKENFERALASSVCLERANFSKHGRCDRHWEKGIQSEARKEESARATGCWVRRDLRRTKDEECWINGKESEADSAMAREDRCRSELESVMATRVTTTGSPGGLSGEAGLAGVPRLLEDLARLSEDKDTADIVFLLGRDEMPIYAHRIILQARSVFESEKRMDNTRPHSKLYAALSSPVKILTKSRDPPPPPTAHPALVALVISKCDADENDA